MDISAVISIGISIVSLLMSGFAIFYAREQTRMIKTPYIRLFSYYQHEDYTAITFTVYCGDNSAYLKELTIKGHLLSKQSSYESGCFLHCVKAPDDSCFSKSLRIDEWLSPNRRDSLEVVACVRPKLSDSACLRITTDCRFRSIKVVERISKTA